MKISYLSILSNQGLIPELFSHERWQSISLDERKEIIYSIFHINNWKKLEPQYRIYFLQELENINANMQDRKAYKVVMIDNMKPSVQTGPKGSNEIYVSSDYVLNGLRYVFDLEQDGKQNFHQKPLDDLNVELFCSLCHEGEHAKQEQSIRKNVNTKEINECRLNLTTNPDSKKNNNIISYNDDPILYKMQPVEYYAFLHSETMTREIFAMLQTKFGIDEGYAKWDEETRRTNFEALARKWNRDNHLKEEVGVEYTVSGIRKMLIHSMAQNVREWYNVVDAYKFCGLNFSRDYSPNFRVDWVDDSKCYDEK